MFMSLTPHYYPGSGRRGSAHLILSKHHNLDVLLLMQAVINALQSTASRRAERAEYDALCRS